MLWKICYILAVVIVGFSVVSYIRQHKIKKVKLSSALKTLLAGFTKEGEADYTVRIHAGVDVRSHAFNEALAKIEKPTFAFVALGDDSRNI